MSVTDFKTAKDLQNAYRNMREENIKLEDALYRVLDSARLDVAKEIAADALDEDMDAYAEEENEELDFDNDEWEDTGEDEDE